MIVDTSALIAILRAEADAERFARALERAPARRISAASYLETATVIDGVGSPELSRSFDEFVDTAELIIEPVTEAQVRLARQAYAAYGKGRGHPARLNFGDCFADALAKERGEPLLFKGADFTHTDVASALPTP